MNIMCFIFHSIYYLYLFTEKQGAHILHFGVNLNNMRIKFIVSRREAACRPLGYRVSSHQVVVLSLSGKIAAMKNTELFDPNLSTKASTTQYRFRKLGKVIINTVTKQRISIQHF